MLGEQGQARNVWRESVGTAQRWTVHSAELIAVSKAASCLLEGRLACESRQVLSRRICTIVSDSKSALQAIQNPARRPGQQVVYEVLATADFLRKQRIDLRLLRIPSHSGTPGNEKDDELAKESVGITENHELRKLLSAQKKQHRDDMIREWQQEWQATKNGQHLERIHEDLLSKRVLRLHDGMSKGISKSCAGIIVDVE